MENKTPSQELLAIASMNKRKADSISKKHLLDSIASLPGEGITGDNIDWEISKKSVKLTIEIDRGSAIECLTYELKTKKV
jgi:hypothetical protein